MTTGKYILEIWVNSELFKVYKYEVDEIVMALTAQDKLNDWAGTVAGFKIAVYELDKVGNRTEKLLLAKLRNGDEIYHIENNWSSDVYNVRDRRKDVKNDK